MLKKAKWLAQEVQLRIKYMTNKDCLFCKIIRGELKTQKFFESEKVIAFADINPVVAVHILIVPKKHIDSIAAVTDEHSSDIVAMFQAAQKLVREKKMDAFRLAFNGGRYQHVPHLHMHLLAGGKVEWSKL